MIVIINNKYIIIKNYNELMRLKYENKNNLQSNISNINFFYLLYIK